MLSPWLWREAIVNAVSYRLRRRLRSGKSGYVEEAADPLEAIAGHPHQQRLGELLRVYAPALAGRHHAANVLENLNVLDKLDRALASTKWQPPGPLAALDVGSQNFYYAAALHSFWSRQGHVTSLTGTEVDVHQVYRNGHSRLDYAESYVKGLAGTRFLPVDARAFTEPVDAITLLLPFLSEAPHLQWGLPLDLLAPRALLSHLWSLLKPGGLLVIENRYDEVDLQDRLLDALGLVRTARVELDEPIIEGRAPRVMTTLAKALSP